MTIIIDDGTFTLGNSFITLEEAENYHVDRATPSWIDTTKTDEDKEAAIIKGFDYLYVQDWLAGVFDIEVPAKVKRAQIIAAEKELSRPGILQEDQDSNLKRKRIEGVIEKEFFSMTKTSATIFTEIQNLLKNYLNISTTTKRQRFLVRM